MSGLVVVLLVLMGGLAAALILATARPRHTRRPNM
ncbi:hypothetical protein SAMN05421748_14822 [Paractinoplanes atraurantiacus]|uniref:Uncharacterized protein n=1 Tax=Paractinoplanes atraurantiacus TaxID=1036182 RepID=A0A285KQW5_9ACTN|nr:hypothetical protein SAMN05421748_14822 [Actinoplanes atraurantiacus]